MVVNRLGEAPGLRQGRTRRSGWRTAVAVYALLLVCLSVLPLLGSYALGPLTPGFLVVSLVGLIPQGEPTAMAKAVVLALTIALSAFVYFVPVFALVWGSGRIIRRARRH